MRVLAIDLGERRTGRAFSDIGGRICGAAFSVEHFNKDELLKRLNLEIASRGVEELVLGLPRNMDGTEGEKANESREFATVLEETFGLPVHLRDERLTTVAAHDILRNCGNKERAHRKNVDAVAASLILTSFLDEKKVDY